MGAFVPDETRYEFRKFCGCGEHPQIELGHPHEVLQRDDGGRVGEVRLPDHVRNGEKVGHRKARPLHARREFGFDSRGGPPTGRPRKRDVDLAELCEVFEREVSAFGIDLQKRMTVAYENAASRTVEFQHPHVLRYVVHGKERHVGVPLAQFRKKLPVDGLHANRRVRGRSIKVPDRVVEKREDAVVHRENPHGALRGAEVKRVVGEKFPHRKENAADFGDERAHPLGGHQQESGANEEFVPERRAQSPEPPRGRPHAELQVRGARRETLRFVKGQKKTKIVGADVGCGRLGGGHGRYCVRAVGRMRVQA